MDFVQIFEKFGLPTAIIVVLLYGVWTVFKMFWGYFTNRLDEAEKRSYENQKEFLSVLSTQNEVSTKIAETLTEIEKNLRDINAILEKISKRRK